MFPFLQALSEIPVSQVAKTFDLLKDESFSKAQNTLANCPAGFEAGQTKPEDQPERKKTHHQQQKEVQEQNLELNQAEDQNQPETHQSLTSHELVQPTTQPLQQLGEQDQDRHQQEQGHKQQQQQEQDHDYKGLSLSSQAPLPSQTQHLPLQTQQPQDIVESRHHDYPKQHQSERKGHTTQDEPLHLNTGLPHALDPAQQAQHADSPLQVEPSKAPPIRSASNTLLSS